MFSYRITKYNPKYRDDNGFYIIHDEWACFSEIGETFNGKTLTMEDYLKVENAHLQAIADYMDYLKLETLRVAYIEKHHAIPEKEKICSESMLKVYEQLYVGQELNKKEIIDLARLIIRGALWAMIGTDNKMFVHFGYDYYMYIGSETKPSVELIEKIEKSGLFVESQMSPYLQDEYEEEPAKS